MVRSGSRGRHGAVAKERKERTENVGAVGTKYAHGAEMHMRDRIRGDKIVRKIVIELVALGQAVARQVPLKLIDEYGFPIPMHLLQNRRIFCAILDGDEFHHVFPPPLRREAGS